MSFCSCFWLSECKFSFLFTFYESLKTSDSAKIFFKCPIKEKRYIHLELYISRFHYWVSCPFKIFLKWLRNLSDNQNLSSVLCSLGPNSKDGQIVAWQILSEEEYDPILHHHGPGQEGTALTVHHHNIIVLLSKSSHYTFSWWLKSMMMV